MVESVFEIDSKSNMLKLENLLEKLWKAQILQSVNIRETNLRL